MLLKIFRRFFISSLLSLFCLLSLTQTLPVGTPLLEEALRRKQIKGESDINISFAVRPLYSGTDLQFDSLYNPSNYLSGTGNKRLIKLVNDNMALVRLLPLIIRQQYNTHHPYGWNDGSMIPARGYQTMMTAGLYAKKGILSIQIQPELVYAQNKDFPGFPSSHTDSIWHSYYTTVLNVIDAPEKYGNGSYTKIFAGQSSARLNYKRLSFGISTENIWWGPGIRNSLIMSNNAPGFPHLTFNTTSPISSPIGTFEGQVISGLLKNSGILPPDTARTFNGQQLYVPKRADNRYLNGMIITWQPKWTKGLHLGFTRVFYLYRPDIESSLNGYLPVLGSFFKGKTKNEDEKMRDQILSLFFRLILPNDHAEFYAEFGRNDHSQNVNDLLQEPEHSRAFLIGGKKIFTTAKNTDMELIAEFTNLQLPTTFLVREQNSWYVHHQVRHGYTNLGQVMGAGIGPGGNSQSIAINWIKGIKITGVMLERVVRNNDFYFNAFAPQRNFKNHWVDLSFNIRKNWVYKRFVFDANLVLIRSLNYHWTNINTGSNDKTDVTNVQLNTSLFYQF
jgi:hypothetical protein